MKKIVSLMSLVLGFMGCVQAVSVKPVEYNNKIVSENVEVALGGFEGKDSIFKGSLKISGGMKLHKSTVSGEVIVEDGGATIVESILKKPVTISGITTIEDSVLKDVTLNVGPKEVIKIAKSTVNHVIVKGTQSPEVRLRESSVKKITFEGAEGRVLLDDESRVGKIVNGTEVLVEMVLR